MTKDPKIEGLNFIDRTLRSKKAFKRLIILVLILTPSIIGGIAAWRGCSVTTSKGTIETRGKQNNYYEPRGRQ